MRAFGQGLLSLFDIGMMCTPRGDVQVPPESHLSHGTRHFPSTACPRPHQPSTAPTPSQSRLQSRFRLCGEHTRWPKQGRPQSPAARCGSKTDPNAYTHTQARTHRHAHTHTAPQAQPRRLTGAVQRSSLTSGRVGPRSPEA